jgi:hypothetical protein
MSTINKVLDAWMQGKSAQMKSKQWGASEYHQTLHTDGKHLWSYALCIGTTSSSSDGYIQKQVLDHRVNDRMTISTQRHIRRALVIAPVHPNFKEKK